MTRALVILSGGQDSTTCLAWAVHRFDMVSAITFNYGQRHQREIQAACNVARACGAVDHEVLDIGPDLLRGTNPLTDHSQPLEQYQSFETMDATIGARVEKTFVPMRNALFMTIAANRAACLGIDTIITGVCQADNANYPDYRQSFVSSQQLTINEALGTTQFKIVTPLMHMSKAESIELARGVGGYPLLALTHTAYDGQYPPNGNDHANVLRRHGFQEVGVPDPLIVRALMEDLSVAGETSLNNYFDKFSKADYDFRVILMKSIHDLINWLPRGAL